VNITLLQALLIAIAAYLGMSVWAVGVGYFTLYRPLIGGLIVGVILGDWRGGMAFGAALNAVHLGFISTGGSLPSDLVTAGYIGTALALASGLDVEAALAAFGIPLGVLGAFLWFGRMTLGSALVQWADARAVCGDTRGVAAINLWAGQGLLFLFYTVPTFVIVYLGQYGIELALELMPSRLLEALAVVGGLLPAVGIGLLLRSIGRIRLLPFALFGFVATTFLELPALVIALLGASAAWLVVSGQFLNGKGEVPSILPGAQGSATVVSESGSAVRRVPPRVRRGAWWRWLFFLHASYNYERMQGLGFAHAMRPVIEYLYPDRPERAAALQRHLVFFNSEPQFGALVPAVIVAMEEERASGADVSEKAINGVKGSLMGPLAGVGDSLIQGLITPLLLSLGITLAMEGRLIGPLLYVGLISAVVIATNRLFWGMGYRWGRAAVSRILVSGWVQALTEAAAVTGMVVAGSLIASLVRISTPLAVAVGQVTVSLQNDVLDVVLKNVLPLAATLGVWWLLERRVPTMRLIGAIFLAGIVAAYAGVLGSSAPPLFGSAWVEWIVGGVPVTLGSLFLHLWPALLAMVVGGLVLTLGKRADS
jgi:PTS system mannose-specific IID component